DLDDFLYLLDVVRSDCGGRDKLVLFPPERRVCVAIEGYVLIAGEDPLFANRVFKLPYCLGEIAGAYARRNFHVCSDEGLPYVRLMGAMTQEIKVSESRCAEVTIGVTIVAFDACGRSTGQRATSLAIRALQSCPLLLRSAASRNMPSGPESACSMDPPDPLVWSARNTTRILWSHANRS